VQRLKNMRKQFKTTNVVEIDAEIAQAWVKLVKHKSKASKALMWWRSMPKSRRHE
jgi:hypothetical protein